MVFSSSTASDAFEFAPDATADTQLVRDLGFLPGLKELLTVRQVHALEHATVWVLSETQSGSTRLNGDSLGGMSTDQGFYLYGAVETPQLQQAVQQALTRLTSGEWNLAVHPRCGTNLSVGMLLTTGLAFGMHLLLPKSPLMQLMGVGMAAAAAVQIAPDMGGLAQRYITTAVPFNLAVDEISRSSDRWGRPVHFIRVHWVG
jgi:Domain of unknown function (DUF6391)